MGGIDGYTKLCSHFNGADGATSYTDPIAGAYTFVGTAQLDTAQSKFGGASILFDGNSDHVTLPDSADWSLGTGDFTLDFWIRFNALPLNGEEQVFFTQFASGASQYRFEYANDGNGYWQLYGPTFSLNMARYSAILANTWYHVAFVRNVNNFYIFQDGVMLGSAEVNSGSMPDVASSLSIGAQNGPTRFFNGWMDEVRLSKGIARWTSNFTPPTSEYNSTEIKKIAGVGYADIKKVCGTSIASIKKISKLA